MALLGGRRDEPRVGEDAKVGAHGVRVEPDLRGDLRRVERLRGGAQRLEHAHPARVAERPVDPRLGVLHRLILPTADGKKQGHRMKTRKGLSTPLALFEIKNLHVAIEDGTEIVRGVDLTVNPGEIHALMGPNGSGKSTLAYASWAIPPTR